MPAISAKTNLYYRERIRSIMVQNPRMTIEGIRQRLEQDGLHLDRHYVGKLVNKIHTERAKRANTWMLNHALASFQDAMEEIVKAGWDVINDPMARNMDKTLAMREIREAYNTSFEKLFDAGVFERKLGTLDAVIRNTPLSEGRKQVLADVFTNWGLIAPQDEPKAITAQNPAKEEAIKEDAPTTTAGNEP